MNLDQVMDTWRSQETAPLYGMNRDLLQLVLEHERADLRRKLRNAQRITYLAASGLALFAAFWIWVLTFKDEPVAYTVLGAATFAVFAAWAVAMWISRKRQATREREFGNTLRAEIERNLSLVDYQLSNGGRWSRALLWTAPPIVGAGLLQWLIALVNHKTLSWYDAGLAATVLMATVIAVSAGSRAARLRLAPRRERLRALLRSFDTAESA